MQSSASTLALVRESAQQKQADDEAERARQNALPKKKKPRQLPPVGGADDASVSSKSSKRKPKRSRSKPAPRGAAARYGQSAAWAKVGMLRVRIG